jgi:peptide/nickel transport system substrate-binding protein
LAYLIDRDEIIDRSVSGFADPLYSQVPPGILGANEAFLERYGPGADVQAAEELLTEVGYTEENPLTFDLWYPPEHYGTYAAQIFQVIEEQFEATPLVQVELQSQEWSTYVGAAISGEYNVSYLGWFFDFADPSNYLDPFSLCDATIGTFYCSEEMDELLIAGRAESDEAARIDLYEQAQALYAEDVVTIPLTIETEYAVLNDSRVSDVVIGPALDFNYELTTFADGVEDTETLIIGTTDQLTSLDYQDAYALHDWELFRNTNVGLYTYEPGTANVVPGVAVGDPVFDEESLTYTIEIDEGWLYPDGTEMVAGDIARAINRGLELAEPSDVASTLLTPYVTGAEAPDDRTLVISVDGEIGFMRQLLTTAPYTPLQEGQYPGDELLRFPETLGGVGPWQIVDYTENEQTVLERNPNYRNGFDEGAPERVIITYYQDPQTMGLALENGDIDVAWRTLGPVESARLGDVDGLTVVDTGGGGIRYLVLNHIGVEAATAEE